MQPDLWRSSWEWGGSSAGFVFSALQNITHLSGASSFLAAAAAEGGDGNVAGTFDRCMPAWAANGTACPHGNAINLPFAAFTAPLHPGLVSLVACCYSMLPFFGMLANLLLILKRRRSREVIWLLFTLSTSGLNALIKLMVGQPRPASCLTSCGMPSGHSCYAIGFLLFAMLWDSVSRVPMDDQAGGDDRRALRGVAFACLLLPVPWSRVQLGDHSESQVFVGSAVGAVGAGIWLLALGPCCEAFLERFLRSALPASSRQSVGGRGGRSGGSAREPVLDRSLIDRGNSGNSLELSGQKSDDFAGVMAAGSMQGSTGAAPAWDEMGDAI
mmetsp:Transcript_90706/g.259492  ORF Transcript_90706/g.259492 Transcript_90706/m.259492 type:complete len:328 (-) Transcript_90706:91-1074(-)